MADRQRLAAILALDIDDFASIQASNKKATLSHLRNFLEIVRDAVAENRGTLFSAERDTFLAEFPSPVAAIHAINAIHEDVAGYNEEQKEAQRMWFRGAVHVGGIAGTGREIQGEAVAGAKARRNFAGPGATAVTAATHKQVVARVDLEWEDLGKQAIGGKSATVLRGVENIDAYASGGSGGRRLTAGLGRRGIAGIVLGAIVTAVVVVFLVQQGPRMGSVDEMATGGGSSPFEGSIQGAMKKGFSRDNAEGENQGEARRSGSGAEPTEDTANGGTLSVPMTLPSEPSIAVLPFANASADRTQDYLATGLAEEISIALSRTPRLFIAAPRSAMGFGPNPDAVSAAARALGVRFVLLGKVVRSGERVRLSVQLMENGTTAPLLVRSFDLGPDDVASAGRRVAQLVASAVGAALTVADVDRLKRQEAANPEAFDFLLRARHALRQENRAATDEAIRLFQASVSADRGFARAYEGSANAHLLAQQWSDDPSSEKSFEAAQRAVALDDDLPAAHGALAAAYLAQRDYERALAAAERAVAVNPNDADGHAMLGKILTWAGSPERGAEEVEKALRRNPQPPFWYLFALGHARFVMEDYSGAIIAFRQGVASNPGWLANRYFLAASYAEAGDQAKAEFELGQGAVRAVMPSVLAGDLTPYRNSDDLDRFVGALRKAGVR